MLSLIVVSASFSSSLFPQVAAALAPHLWGASAGFGNPSSGHVLGRRAAAALARARRSVASLLSDDAEADADGVVFVSCGTEANALALRGVLSCGGRCSGMSRSYRAAPTRLAAQPCVGVGRGGAAGAPRRPPRPQRPKPTRDGPAANGRK